MNRLDFMACPCCSGHEKIGADTAVYLEEAIDHYLSPCIQFETEVNALPEHVRGELLNIRNVLRNSTEIRPAPAVTVDDDPLLA